MKEETMQTGGGGFMRRFFFRLFDMLFRGPVFAEEDDY